MSRTYRNRNTVPHGHIVRDGGKLFNLKHPGIPIWGFDTPEYRRSIFRCEGKAQRVVFSRKYRRRENCLVRQWRWDDIPPRKRTSGWLTW